MLHETSEEKVQETSGAAPDLRASGDIASSLEPSVIIDPAVLAPAYDPAADMITPPQPFPLADLPPRAAPVVAVPAAHAPASEPSVIVEASMMSEAAAAAEPVVEYRMRWQDGQWVPEPVARTPKKRSKTPTVKMAAATAPAVAAPPLVAAPIEIPPAVQAARAGIDALDPEDIPTPPPVVPLPVIGAPVVVAPVVISPVVETPVVAAPVAEVPVEIPVVAAPVAEVPVVEALVVEVPVVEVPVIEAPVVEVPVAEAPVAEVPVVEAPVVEVPIAAAPVAEVLVVEAPVVEIPVAAAPVAEVPVVEAPVVDAPFAEVPVAAVSIVEPPVTEAAVAAAPPAEEAFSSMMQDWLASGDKEPEPEAKEDAEVPEESPLQPARWRQYSDGGRFAVLLTGAVLVSIVVVSVARSYSRPTVSEPPAHAAAAAPAPSAPSPVAAAQRARPPAAPATRAPQPAHQAGRVAARVPSRSGGGDRFRACRNAVNTRRPHEALAACRVAADGAPTSPAAILLLARAHYLAGRQSDSLQLARRAVAMDPRNADAYLLLGSVQRSAGHPRDARAAYEAYLRLAPRGRHAAETRVALRNL